jgi:hypothetical protein
MKEAFESVVSGLRNEDCGGRGQNAHIPSEAAAEAQTKEVDKNEATAPDLTEVKCPM